jgi:hypothetical protein
MKLSRSILALALAPAHLASACEAANTTTTVALAAPIVVTEPFAVPVPALAQPATLVTPTVVTPTIVTPAIVQAVPQNLVVKEVVRQPHRRVQVTRTVTRSR